MSTTFFHSFPGKYPKLDLKDGGKYRFWGRENGAPSWIRIVRHIIGKLSKFHTTCINLGIVPVCGT